MYRDFVNLPPNMEEECLIRETVSFPVAEPVAIPTADDYGTGPFYGLTLL